MKAVEALAAVAVLAGLATGLGTALPEPEPAQPRGRPSLVASGIVASETDAEGNTVVVRVAEVRRRDGRIGFLRSPLLAGLELRGVRVTRNGRVVSQLRAVEIPTTRLAAGSREARLADPAVARLHRLAGLRPLLEAVAR